MVHDYEPMRGVFWVDVCTLDLGRKSWVQMEDRRAKGKMRWGDKPEVSVAARVRGAHSRRFPKRSLEVRVTKGEFPDEPPVGHKVERVHLNADYVDPTLLRSALSFLLFKEVGAPAPHCRHTPLVVSGKFAGVYVALESVDNDFCRRRGWAPGPIFYAVTREANFGLANPFSRKLKKDLSDGYQDFGGHGTETIQRMVKEINLAPDAEFSDVVNRWFDVEAYLKWLMVAVFVGNRDGFVHNYALYQEPGSDRFRLVPWDYDATFGIDINGRPAAVGRVPLIGWNKLSHRLLALAEYRETYRSAFLEALETYFSLPFLREKVERFAGQIQRWVEKDRHRRGARQPYQEHLDYLLKWSAERRELLAEELKTL